MICTKPRLGRVRLGFGLALAVNLAALAAQAQENWPQFRGPGARGVGESPRLPVVWSAGTNVAWRSAVPGRGWSSPIVWGDRVFCSSEDSDTYVFAAGDAFKLERVNSLGEMCMAPPALARDSIVIRTLSHLYRIKEQP